MFRNHATDGITVSWLASLHMSWIGVKTIKTVGSSYLYIYGGYSKKGFCGLFQIYSSEFLCERLWWHTSRPSLRCRCCPGLDLLPMRCQGQKGTGATPPSVLGSWGLHCAGCERCQLSSFARFYYLMGFNNPLILAIIHNQFLEDVTK